MGAWLARNRDPLLKRWLGLIIERSSLDELAARPLPDRIKDIDLLLEAVRDDLPGGGAASRGPLWEELERQLDAHRRFGSSFALAIIAVGPAPEIAEAQRPAAGLDGHTTERRAGPSSEAWALALHDIATSDEVVLEIGDAMTAVVLPHTGAAGGRLAADRLRVSAWKLLGGRGRLADVGLATCPEDATAADELMSVARDRLWRVLGARFESYAEMGRVVNPHALDADAPEPEIFTRDRFDPDPLAADASGTDPLDADWPEPAAPRRDRASVTPLFPE